MVTANRAPQVDFPSSVLPVLWLCTTVFAWLTPSLMDCRVWSQVIAFGGAYRFTVFRAQSLTKNSCNTKVVFNHFDPGSIIYRYILIYACGFLRQCPKQTFARRKPGHPSSMSTLNQKVNQWISMLPISGNCNRQIILWYSMYGFYYAIWIYILFDSFG